MATFRNRKSGGAFTLVELLVVIAIIGILVALLLPAIQAARESARRAQCTSNLKNVALALLNFHDVKKEFPAAVLVRPNGSDDILTHNVMFRNWAIDILPYLEAQAVYDTFVLDFSTPLRVGDRNKQARGTEITVMLCPSDEGQGRRFEGSGGNWARGNYGYNGFQFWPNNYVWKALLTVAMFRPYYQYNLGVGGIEDGETRQVLDASKITDGLTKTIMLAEMRVGMSERDRRGVWAMGMCGSNFHCRHAGTTINGCDQDDDLFGGDDVIADVGDQRLRSECMSVAPGLNMSGQSAVRSRHPGGANVAMADGSVRFLGDFIDYGNVAPHGYIPDDRPDDIKPENFGTWQRLNVSRDGYSANDY